MKTINSLISVIVLLVMLVSPLGNVSARGETEAPQQSFSKLVWESKPDMPTARYNMGAAVSGGKIYVIGGDNYTCTALSNVHEYDPVTETWTTRADMPTGRWGVGVATGPDGQIYAFGGMGGGYCGADMLTTVEAYDPATDSWATRASMPTQRSGFGVAAAINGKIYIIGGGNSNGLLATVEEYNPATDSWTQKADMPWPNNNVALAAASNGKIYVLGGDVTTEVLQEYDPEQDSWTQQASIPVSRYGVKIAQASDGRIYAVGGGIGGGYTTSVEAYDPASDTWVADSSINIARSGHILVAVGDQIFAMGGWGPTGGTDGGPLSSVEAGTITPLPLVLYAKQDGLTSGSCDSWDNACDLQYALTSAVASQEIWVAAGIYKPTTDLTDRTATFQLKNGVALYGGFAGTETTRDERNWKTNKTVLSGDIDNNDINDDGNFIAETTADIQGGNAYHVVIGNNIDNTTVLDGFTITAGQANSPGYSHGGGMFNEYYSSPILTNIVFSANMASNTPDLPGDGGGMYNSISNPILINVTFFANSASLGGGLYNSTGSSTILNDVLFSNNSAGSGAGMLISDGNPELKNVIFYHNSASWTGGGLFNSNGSPRLINTTFFENSAARSGGGMESSTYNPPSLINNIFWGNSAPDGPQISSSYYSLNVTYSDVQNGWPGNGNIDADPLFVDAADGDLHLQAGSPAIDSGTNESCPSTDLDGVSRPQDGNGDGFYTCDMGAFEVEGKPGTPPTNDNFADALVIGALPFNDMVYNMFATAEPDEPQSCSDSPRTVWYKFTPIANAEVNVSADGSSFDDTVISIYEDTGTGITGLNELNCVSWGGSFTFSTQAGVTYYVQAGSINSFGGELHVNLQEVLPPANDDFANATSMYPLPFSDTVNTTWATVEPGESHYCDTSPRTVWYKFTPGANMEVRVTTEGSPFSDIVLTAYRDTGGGLAGLNAFTCVSYVGSLTFGVEEGVTYYIQAGYISSLGELDVHLQEVPPPANDNFADATVISSPLPFDETVDAAGATAETGEPASTCAISGYGGPYKSIWYAYTPATDGVISASVPTAAFAPVLAVFSGNALNDLSEIGCQVFLGNPVTFPVSGGTTYYFQISKFTTWDPDGSVQFHLEEKHPPSNDNLAAAFDIPSLPFNDVLNNTDATLEQDESQPCPWAYNSYNTVWYKFTPQTKMALRADMAGSSFDNTAITLFLDSGSGITPWACRFYGDTMPILVEPGITYYFRAGNTYPGGGELHFSLYEVPVPPNDNFGNAGVITSLPFTDRLDNLAATAEPNEPQNCDYSERTVWYLYTPTEDGLLVADMYGSNVSDTVLSVYQDMETGLGGLQYLGCMSYGGSVSVKVKAGNTYYIQAKNIYGGGIIQVNVQQFPVPPNDDFIDAKTIEALSYTDTEDISNATIEPGEPQGCYYSPKTVWYSFTPATNMLVQADMSGSSFWDTVLNIYQATGPNISDLTFQQCANFGESARFTAQAGVTYYLQAGNYYGGGGTLQLNIQELPRPVNDDFANATIIPGPLPFEEIPNTQYATREPNEPQPSCQYSGSGERSVWYAYTPSTDGSLSANIPWATVAPVLAVYTGSSLSDLTEIGCQSNSSSLLTFKANAGTTYYFQISNFYSWEGGGEIDFRLEITPLPVAEFSYYPSNPSTFDTIEFYNSSYDPGNVGFDSVAWDFGDGTTSVAFMPTHVYAKDGDYTVKLSATTFDGRSASANQVIQVRTRDVAITKLSAPQSASAGQTRTITVSVNSKAYSETVKIDLYRSVAGGFEYIETQTKVVPARSTNRTVAYSFNYTFTSSDASIGKVTFYAVATIVDGRDIYPSDNQAYSSPPTRVNGHK